MDEWHVGDPPDWGDSVGVPDIPYMGYINDGEDEDPEYPEIRSISKSKRLKEEALDLRDQGEYHGALLTINSAIEIDGRNPDFYNVKAIILEDLGNYSEALRYYDIALGMHHAQLFKDNKARLLGRIANTEIYTEDRWDHAMDCVNEALKITRDKTDRKDLLRIKADILEKQGIKVDSQICIYLANDMYDEVERTEKQTEIIKNSTGTLICITGTQFYDKKVNEGNIVSLIIEPDNEHDKDAIRVEKDGETVGYVANSPYTLVDGAKGASEIKHLMKPNQKAKVMFTYIEEYLMAKLI